MAGWLALARMTGQLASSGSAAVRRVVRLVVFYKPLGARH